MSTKLHDFARHGKSANCSTKIHAPWPSAGGKCTNSMRSRCSKRAPRARKTFAVAISDQGLDLSDRGGGDRDGVREVLPQLLKVLGGHGQDHFLVLPDPGAYRLRPSEHVLRLFEWGLRHEVTLVPMTRHVELCATCTIGTPSRITASTAWYLRSTTLSSSNMSGSVSRIRRSRRHLSAGAS